MLWHGGRPRRGWPWAAAALLLVACERGAPPAEEAPAPVPATVVIATMVDITGVNPLIGKATEFHQDIFRQAIFQQLLEEGADFEQGPATFAPALAESWSFSEDGLELTFELRGDAVWSDGTPITAADVRWTWEAQMHPDVAWGYASAKERIEDVEVLGERTVRFRFSEAYPEQLADANEGVVLPRHVWRERPFEEWRSDAGWFQDHLVTSGPFQLASWRPNERLDLVSNPRFYRPGLPRLERVVFRVIPEKTSQVNQLLGGELDYVQQVPPHEIQRLEGVAGVEIDEFWGRQYNYLCWNTRHPPFADAEVRRALTLAIDRQQIIDTLYRGYARPSLSPILSSIWAFNRDLESWPYDPKVARLILVRKGFTDDNGDGFLEYDGERFSFELLVNVGNRILLDAATMIQEQMRQVGIEVTMRSVEFGTFVQRVTDHDFEASLGGWNIDTSLDLHYAFHSDSSDGGYNFGSYSNAEVDALIEQFRLTDDRERKREMLYRIQEILHDEQPYTFLMEPMRINARRSRLRGTRPNAISSYANLEEWWVEGSASAP